MAMTVTTNPNVSDMTKNVEIYFCNNLLCLDLYKRMVKITYGTGETLKVCSIDAANMLDK